MANHHSFQKSFNYRVTQSNISSGLSKSLVNESNKMDSTRIVDSGFIESNQERKRRCFEKLVVGRKERVDAKCGFEVDLIDDTALIEVTGSVSGVIKKDGFKKDSDGKKKKNKGCKKRNTRCSMKSLNEKKYDGKVIEDRGVIEKKVFAGKSQKCDARVVEDRAVIEKKKKVLVGKGQKVFRKKAGKVKAVYQRKDAVKIPGLVETGVEDPIVNEKIVQENEVNLNMSNVSQEKEPTVVSVETATVNEKDDIQVNTETDNLIEPETVKKKDDGLKPSPEIEAPTETVCENTTVESKKIVYSRVELVALRFVNEEGQKSKWMDVYGAFSPLVAKEYAGLVADVNNRLTKRYNNRVVNCGYGYTRLPGNAILSMPPIFPVCSSLVYRRVDSYDRIGLRENYY